MEKERNKVVVEAVFAAIIAISGIGSVILHWVGGLRNNVEYVKYSFGYLLVTCVVGFIYGLYRKQKIMMLFLPVIIGLIYTYIKSFGFPVFISEWFGREGMGYLFLQYCNWM